MRMNMNMGRRPVFGGSGGVDLNALSSQSVRLPNNNLYQTSEVAGAACILFDTTNVKTFLIPTQGDMLYMRLRFPWNSCHSITNTSYSIIDNSQATTFSTRIECATLTETDQRVIKGHFGSASVQLDLTLPAIPLSVTDITIGFWVDGNATSGTLYGAVINSNTGAQIGSTASTAHAGWTGTNNFQYLYIGGDGVRNDNVPSGTGFSNFEIDLFGIYANGGNTGTLSSPLTKLQSLAGGGNPNTVFGGNNLHLICRKWTDPTDLDTPFPDSEYSGPARADPVFQVTSLAGASLMKGGHIGPQSASEYLVVNAIKENSVFPIEFGGTTASISITGHTSLADGQGIEMRAFSQEDGTVAMDWTSVATVASNAFTVSAACPATKGFGMFQFRAASDPTNTNLQYLYRRPVGVGYKVAVLGQSQQRFFGYLDGEATSAASLSNPTTPRISFTFGRNFGASNENVVTILPEDGYFPMDDGLLSYDARWRQLTDAPCELVHHAQNSTSQDEMADDAKTDRDFSDSTAVSAVAGANYSIIWDQWGTTISAISNTNYEDDIIDKFYLGNAVTAGDTITLDSGTYDVDHSILGINSGTANDNSTFNSSGWDLRILMCPLSRHGENTDQTPALDESENGSGLIDYRRLREIRQAQISAASTYSEIILGLYCNDIYTDSGLLGFHQDQGSIYGDIRYGIRGAESVATGLGLASYQPPEITGVTVSGDTLTVSINMKSMGDLVVGTDLTGVSVPSGYPAISGFEVSEDGGSTWSLSGFTPAITSTSGTVTLTRDSGTWSTSPATQVRFMFGAPNARDIQDDAIVHGTLYADIGVNTATDFGKATAGLQVAGPAGPFTAS